MAGKDDDLDVRAGSIEVVEHQLHDGLAAVLPHIQALNTTSGIKSGLTVAVLEMNAALDLFALNDKQGAHEAYARMLKQFRDVMRNDDTLYGRSAEAKQVKAGNVYNDVMVIYKHLTTDSIKQRINDAGQLAHQTSWGEALKALRDSYKEARNLSTPQKLEFRDYVQGETSALSGLTPEPSAEMLAKGDHLSLKPDQSRFTSDAPAEARTADGNLPWKRSEFKNLAIIAEHLTKPGREGRKDALVVMSALRKLNSIEYNFITPSKAVTAGIKESREVMGTAIKALLANDGLDMRLRANIERFYPPVAARSEQFQKYTRGPGILSQAFHAVAQVAKMVMSISFSPATPKADGAKQHQDFGLKS